MYQIHSKYLHQANQKLLDTKPRLSPIFSLPAHPKRNHPDAITWGVAVNFTDAARSTSLPIRVPRR